MTASTKTALKIHPVILCGGSGSRLWPLSRADRPKQFLNLLGKSSMLQDTALRVFDQNTFHAPILVTDEKFEFLARKQLVDVGVSPELTILEPMGRNTAPAIAMAALALNDIDPGAILLVLPSDHAASDLDAFRNAVVMGAKAAREDTLVTFGATANRPEVGYGYIRRGKKLSFGSKCYKVDGFIEKPWPEQAEEMIESGGHYWNSGIFMFSVTKYLEELEAYAPEILERCIEAYSGSVKGDGTIIPNRKIFFDVPAISIDYAIMEHTKDAVVIAMDIGWSDVGSWQALSEYVEGDDLGNSTQGNVVLHECGNVHVQGSDRLITAIGLDDLVIVDTPDALLVMPKGRSQDVRTIVDQLKSEGREEAVMHRKVHRPWGSYEGLHWGVRHQVKHIVVSPGEQLSLQYHHHRSEHWTIVSGTAEVTLDDEVLALSPNDSIYIPLGAIHRIFNPGKVPVHLIEVQVGEYLGEDDIVRIEDDYGRVADLFSIAAETSDDT